MLVIIKVVLLRLRPLRPGSAGLGSYVLCSDHKQAAAATAASAEHFRKLSACNCRLSGFVFWSSFFGFMSFRFFAVGLLVVFWFWCVGNFSFVLFCFVLLCLVFFFVSIFFLGFPLAGSRRPSPYAILYSWSNDVCCEFVTN